MNDLDEEVPTFIARLLGHVCGVLFLLLSALCIWIVFMFFLNPKAGAFFLLILPALLSYFFFRTTVKLTAPQKTQIISKSGYLAFIIILFFTSVMSLITAVLNIFNSNDEILNNIFLLCVSGISCISALVLKTNIKS